ncbi:MAG TPA: glycosyl hydrolase family 28-related protein [Verrucomicrobiae bacterium]|nr:glycosyl hydrolase family 28-related protein [Verrucomicrobiae bacterium]
MEPDNHISRRQMLSRLGFTAAGGAFAGADLHASGAEASPRSGPAPQALNVQDFGAAPDASKDSTAAFQAAMKAAANGGNLAVFVPRGQYRIEGHLDVPPNVMLEGVFRAPAARQKDEGSVLLALAGAGDLNSTPFITLHASSTLRGLTVFYPEQKMQNPPVPYPWTIRGQGDNISLLDVLLVNPYQAVDFGTFAAGRHFISGLYGQPLYRGLFIDQCFDVGRVENVHFWTFWGGWEHELYDFIRAQGVAFILGRTDWQFLSNCFCIGYSIGYHFVQNHAGPGNCLLTQCGSDVGPLAVRVEAGQSHAGHSFVNCQFMAGIEIAQTNSGPVKFTACGFWGIPTTDHHARLQGTGQTTFLNCHFINWGQKNAKAAAIEALSGGLTVSACDFMDAGKPQISLGPQVAAALIYGNRLRGQSLIANEAGSRAQLGLNSVSDK